MVGILNLDGGPRRGDAGVDARGFVGTASFVRMFAGGGSFDAAMPGMGAAMGGVGKRMIAETGAI